MLVFPRNKREGEKVCQALASRYRPSLEIYRKEKDLDRDPDKDPNKNKDPQDRSPFERLKEFDLVIAVMAVGIVVRLLCNTLEDKWTETPVVAVDSSLRCAVPVVGGHHGANDLALHLAEEMNMYPAITTATDSAGKPSLEGTAEQLGAKLVNRECSKEVNLAFLQENVDVPILRLKGPRVVLVDDDVAVLKSRGGVVVGLGTRRGVTSQEVIDAITTALRSVGKTPGEIRVMATAWIKHDERGIEEAAENLNREVIYLDEHVLNSQTTTTPSRASDLGLIGVAEPAAMALSTRLLMPKRIYGRVTVALGE